MTVSIDELKNLFELYAIENYENDLLEVMKNKEVEKHYGIMFNFILLFEKNVDLGHGLLSNAVTLLPQLDYTLVSAQRKILTMIAKKNHEVMNTDHFVVKMNVHVRMTGLPACPDLNRTSFPRNRDVGSLLTVVGTITRITSPKMLEFRREYSCSKCKKIFVIKAEYETYYSLKNPSRCLNELGCNGTNFTPMKQIDQWNYKDYQEIKIQEQVNKLNIGTVPQSLWATLEDDLVDSCKPGDDVVLCGTVMRRWKNDSLGNKHDIELFFRVSHVSVSNDQTSYVTITKELVSQFENFWGEHQLDELTARNLIVASICPRVYGLYLIKLAVAIILAGGVGKHQEAGGCRLRGESHLLLVGDPGTGKSHIIRFAAKICSRSVHTTGIGSTSAGLTVTAIHEGGEWQLEAGALVLADGGICCIDEFNSIREHDRTAIHEAMEQQTISVAKAGVVCKLNTRCSVIAATNPKGHYDSEIPITVNVAVASPLLSRFDLVFILLDSKNPTWDEIVSRFILEGKDELGIITGRTSLWSVEKLQEYFSVVKNLNPTLTEEANLVLQRYYQAHRQANHGHMARTTVRLLESLIRLSEGHARLMFREKVLVQDAIVAISLIESSILGTHFFGDVDALHTTFPDNPKADYISQARIVLQKLRIPGIEVDESSQTQNNRAVIVTHSQPVAAARVTTSSSTVEKLTEILSNIRKTKEKTALNCIAKERSVRRRKRTASHSTDAGAGSDSENEFLQTVGQKRQRIVENVDSDNDEGTTEVNRIRTHEQLETGEQQNSRLNRDNVDEVVSEDDIEGSLPLFGQFVSSREKRLQVNLGKEDDHVPPPSQTETGSSTIEIRQPSDSHASDSTRASREQLQVDPGKFVHTVNGDTRVVYAGPNVADSNQDAGNSSRTRAEFKKPSTSPRNAFKKNIKISPSTMSKLKMFSVSSKIASTSSSNGQGDSHLLGGASQSASNFNSAIVSVTNEELPSSGVNGNPTASISDAKTAADEGTRPFASGGNIASLNLFSVDDDDLSILDDF